ncbi:4725_t:CDS:2 [Paraglomus brasilianum]|uniref:4725_t:CDS:1 n=1 Tax=Paraglomus brasilianum TaxID=144538 RepID=A0A9N8W5L2_9GLOM|nr:4725_t:CDS:2 [Paraglomus brasilianum]
MELYDGPRKKPLNEDVYDNNGIDEEEFTEINVAENQPSLPARRRFLLAIAGIPGSGKSTFAKNIVNGVNNSFEHEAAVLVPMDGFHYTKKELEGFENPEEARMRRGAHWTFNAQGLLSLISLLREDITDAPIFAPSFIHGIGDPKEDDIQVSITHRLVVLEGLYLHLTEPPPWNEISSNMDELWFITVDPALARSRLIKRHMKSGIALTEDAAAHRADTNDIPNGEFLLKYSAAPDRIIQSIEEEGHGI